MLYSNYLCADVSVLLYSEALYEILDGIKGNGSFWTQKCSSGKVTVLFS